MSNNTNKNCAKCVSFMCVWKCIFSITFCFCLHWCTVQQHISRVTAGHYKFLKDWNLNLLILRPLVRATPEMSLGDESGQIRANRGSANLTFNGSKMTILATTNDINLANCNSLREWRQITIIRFLEFTFRILFHQPITITTLRACCDKEAWALG